MIKISCGAYPVIRLKKCEGTGRSWPEVINLSIARDLQNAKWLI